jgi:BirA family biotin operon repressor/biotin-[acetyl-CoA-carboxylase] ligase
LGFSGEALQAELHTARFGRAARVVAETASTIDLSWQWLREGGPEGGVVVADRQTRGRGRRGRGWVSPPGGLWMSILARPGLPAPRVGRLSVGLCLAAAGGLRQLGVEVGVKWPNDLLVGGRKVGGVLVETKAVGELVESAVLSLGANVNLSPDDLPSALRAAAISLRDATGREWSLESVAARVLDSLEALWPDVIGDSARLSELWRECDVLSGRQVAVKAGHDVIRGRAHGIDQGGALVLEVAGASRSLVVGETAEVRMAE